MIAVIEMLGGHGYSYCPLKVFKMCPSHPFLLITAMATTQLLPRILNSDPVQTGNEYIYSRVLKNSRPRWGILIFLSIIQRTSCSVYDLFATLIQIPTAEEVEKSNPRTLAASDSLLLTGPWNIRTASEFKIDSHGTRPWQTDRANRRDFTFLHSKTRLSSTRKLYPLLRRLS